MLQSLKNAHFKFIHDALETSKFYTEEKLSIVPTILFLTSSFILSYKYSKIRNSCNWKTKLYNNIFFHCVFFCSTQFWFLFIKISKLVLDEATVLINDNFITNAEITSMIIILYTLLVTIFTVSAIPSLFLIQSLYQRWQESQNVIQWVVEDRWPRTEIGISGHYLNNPPRVYYELRNLAAYRNKRSCSVDTQIVSLRNTAMDLKPSKSATNIRSSSEDLQ